MQAMRSFRSKTPEFSRTPAICGVIVEREFSPLDAVESTIMVQSLKIAHTGLTEIPLPFGI